MTKLFALLVLYKGENSAHILKAAYDLASFGYFQRSSMQEFLSFTSKILIERSNIGERYSVKEGEYMCYAYVRSDSLVGLCVSDHEYPHRVVHTLLTKILEDFTEQVPKSQWTEGKEVAGFAGPLDTHLKTFQNPVEADPMMKVQNELDETKIILHDTIRIVLSRGEKLDDIVDKSEELSLQAKTFYKTPRKTNSCCGSWTWYWFCLSQVLKIVQPLRQKIPVKHTRCHVNV